MDRKQLCVANLRYKRPSPDEARRMRNLLGYLTYRDSRDQGVKMVSGVERWTNRGMGGSVAEIARRCDDLRSDHVLTFSLVINPNPQIMAMIPLEQRERFVRELTERTVDDFFEARGLDTGCEFSYVLHHRESDDPQAPGLHNPHTHVVLPGTVWSEESGERIPLYFSRNKKVNHIEMLHDVTEQNMAVMLDHTVGLDWEQRMDELEKLRQEQKRITEADPHGYHIDDEGESVPFWGGIRQVDETSCAVGYYIPFQTEIQFRPIAQGLDTDFARIVTESVAETLPEFPEEDALELYRATVKRMVESDQADIQPRSPELEL
jgi:hypothetical protein